MSLLSLFMNQVNNKNPKEWSKEERERVVSVFEWLLKEDEKQNPDRYKTKKSDD